MGLSKKTQTVLADYHDRISTEDDLMRTLPKEEMMKRRDEFLLPIGREAGQFIYTLAKSSKAKTILEVGTSYGYSTIWLAAAAKENGSKLISLELDERKAVYTKTQVKKAGLLDHVEFRLGDALASLGEATEFFDFVLLDIWKSLYTPCFELFFPKLSQGAFVVADNMIDPPSYKYEMEGYRSRVKETRAFDSLLLPIGSGLEVSCLI